MVLPSILDLYRLRRQQWLETRELEEIQRKKLRAMINHAYRNVAYYRRLFDSAGIRPEDIKTADDLVRVPITGRQDLQRLPSEDIVAKNIDLKLCKRLLTSGSSGIPLTVYRTARDCDFYDMVWARTFLENGLRLRDKIADLYYYDFPPKRWFERLGIWRKTIISVMDDPRKQIETLRRVRPDVMRGDPFALVNLASVVQQMGIDGINPRVVFTMANLLDQQSRGLIESALHTRVFDCYGAIELGCIAWECSARRGYHINIDTVVVEFIKYGESVGKGERGKIVCTGLHSFAMPFIRYDLGDVGIASDEKCPCDRGMPLLKGLEGRADDFLVSADGTLHSPPAIINQIELIAAIRQFRIIQDSERKVTAQIVPDKGISLETSEKIKHTMTKIMGDDLEIQLEIVDAIPPDPSGKIRSIISKVKKQF